MTLVNTTCIRCLCPPPSHLNKNSTLGEMSGNWAFRILDPVNASALQCVGRSSGLGTTSSRSEAQGDPAMSLWPNFLILLLDLFVFMTFSGTCIFLGIWMKGKGTNFKTIYCIMGQNNPGLMHIVLFLNIFLLPIFSHICTVFTVMC